ncbi:dTMP kinase [Amycolatopsis lexingtonensis]|uniref:Thymidylate kinase n=1 Tax=Amycolatopsis lexingtonensis TaxID=218822 RepID=A0ABR9HT33_9PSEU|nr:dTMP kinase [Amycolatopsis lexingtonensis]MBE1494084.1 dTMP kinase [Amycolatopsis lexingtonensis]
MTAPRLPGKLVTFEGPGGVGKTTITKLVADMLDADGVPVHATTQPSSTSLGKLAREGTDVYLDMALACLCAADRHHQLATEILPALTAGKVVLCDRYVASSLVLQRLDGIPLDVVWALNHGVYRPDLVFALSAAPAVVERRLRARGTHSRFERPPGISFREAYGYLAATTFLHDQGWPIQVIDCAADPQMTADTIVDLIHRTLTESPACP